MQIRQYCGSVKGELHADVLRHVDRFAVEGCFTTRLGPGVRSRFPELSPTHQLPPFDHASSRILLGTAWATAVTFEAAIRCQKGKPYREFEFVFVWHSCVVILKS